MKPMPRFRQYRMIVKELIKVKYDLTKKQTIGASRTLYSLQRAMLSMLCQKSFEAIAVGELCEIVDKLGLE